LLEWGHRSCAGGDNPRKRQPSVLVHGICQIKLLCIRKYCVHMYCSRAYVAHHHKFSALSLWSLQVGSCKHDDDEKLLDYV